MKSQHAVFIALLSLTFLSSCAWKSKLSGAQDVAYWDLVDDYGDRVRSFFAPDGSLCFKRFAQPQTIRCYEAAKEPIQLPGEAKR